MHRLLLALAAALALSGCGMYDRIFGRSSGPKPAALVAIANPAPVKLLWSASVGRADRYIFMPAVIGDSVYAAARDGTVTRLDAASGQSRWRVSVERRLSGGVGADERTVVVGTDEGEVIALDASSGALRWRSRVSSEVFSRPAIGGGAVLVRSTDNKVFAFNDEDGRRRWVYQRTPSSLIMRAPSGLVARGDTLFAGFPGGKLVALAISSGAVRWEATISLPKGSTELERVSDVVGEPVLQSREVCAASYQGRVACFEAESGRQTWARDLSSLTGVSLDARYAFASDDHGAVHELDRTSGRSVWKQDQLTLRQLSLPLPVGNAVAVGDFEGQVHFLSRESGAFVSRYATSGGAVRAAPAALPGGGVLIQTQNGGLFALAL
ncbi:MAG TPA: outer membrane protein assembly factor BamB [Burkholderiales bacterium]|nr:outer membrane protein assembly factor BamB [Burkholderiales bacterium]